MGSVIPLKKSANSAYLEIKNMLGAKLQKVESLIEQKLKSDVDLIEKMSEHHLKSGGKRLRALLTLESAKLNGYKEDVRDINLAACVELIHSATLLHDDVIDEGDERRGQPTARRVYSNSASILGGDHLLIEALRLVQHSGQPQLLGSLLDTISEIVTAEALQLEWRGRFEPDRLLYMRVIQGKTAVLFRWGFEAGATLAGLSDEQIDNLKQAGMALGEAFQRAS